MLVEMHSKLQELTALTWVTHDYAFAMGDEAHCGHDWSATWKVRGRRANNDGVACSALCKCSPRPQDGIK
jgi:hypothetical protein